MEGVVFMGNGKKESNVEPQIRRLVQKISLKYLRNVVH
jgi:hypothetical protein